jgi:hypothetical protein
MNLKGVDKITPEFIAKAERQGYNLSSIIAQAERKGIPVAAKAHTAAATQTQAMQQSAQNRATAAAPTGTQATFSYSPAGSISSVTYAPTSPPSQSYSAPSSSAASTAAAPTVDPLQGYVSFMNAQSANTLAAKEVDKQIEALRDAGMTERQRLVNENNLAVTEKEVGGKLDLQKIVNAGYKNIANIERGSNMFASIMSAFNF